MTGLPLSLQMQAPIEAALSRLRAGSAEQGLSDHAFSNLYLFRAAHDYRYLPGPWPAISGRTYDGAGHLMPLFALRDAPVEVLLSLIDKHDVLYPLAERDAKVLPSSLFNLSCSEDDADYLYPASRFAQYTGRSMSDKRGQVRELLAAHSLEARRFDQDVVDSAREVLEGWMAQRGKRAGEADESACIDALDNAMRFGLEGFVHFADGAPVGFVLAQELQPGVFVMRFAKGLDSHVGIYPHMFQHFCKCFARPVAWLNFEQDMGLPGFRRSKRSYEPAALIPKFRASVRG